MDLETIHWLEEFLLDYKGTLIVISHDRHFLNAVCTHIADIDYDTIINYPGSYDDMVEHKMQARQRIENENKDKGKKIAQLQEFVNRFAAGQRSSPRCSLAAKKWPGWRRRNSKNPISSARLSVSTKRSRQAAKSCRSQSCLNRSTVSRY